MGHFISFVDAKRDQLAQIMAAFVLGMLEYSICSISAITYLSTILCLALQTQVRGNVNLILLILLPILITNIH